MASQKYLILLIMLITTIGLTAGDLIHDLIHVSGLVFNGGSLLTPIFFILLDVVAEVYGYKISKKIIWGYGCCTLLHAALVIAIPHLPSAMPLEKLESFNWVFGSTTLIFISSTLGIVIGMFLNSYYLIKWKLLFKGKYFGLRSIGATLLGEWIQLIIIFPSLLFVYSSISTVIHMSLSIYLLRVLFANIFAYPGTLLTNFLKSSENIVNSEHGVVFNPFK